MAQKGRNDLQAVVNSRIYDNENKEIVARYVREVLEDYRDSYFNLIDDHLKNIFYEDNQTLEQKLSSTANIPPLWGATQYFDIGSNSGDLSGQNKGIVRETSYRRLNSSNSELKIKLNKSISGKKVMVNITTNRQNMIDQIGTFCPVLRYGYASKEIKVGIREGSREVQSIRIEIFAFNVREE